LSRVRLPIYLDDQVQLRTAKIDDQRTDRMLPAEFHTELAGSQLLPEQIFTPGRGMTKLSRRLPDLQSLPL
jgi:hypothetical protein